MVEEYRNVFDKFMEEYITEMKERHKEKEKELKLFESVVMKLKKKNEAMCIKQLDAFEARKKRVLKEYEATLAHNNPDFRLLEGLLVEVIISCNLFFYSLIC